MNETTKYLMRIASFVCNYCEYLKKDMNEYSDVLGYVFRVHQDRIKDISPQGIALILINLKDVKKEDYGKYVDTYKDKVDDIIKNSKTIDEQVKKMSEIEVK